MMSLENLPRPSPNKDSLKLPFFLKVDFKIPKDSSSEKSSGLP